MDEFLNTFIASRTLSHLRQIKSQKLSELVRERSPTRNVAQNNMSWNTEYNSSSVAPYPSNTSGQYPSGGGYSMPTPDFYAR